MTQATPQTKKTAKKQPAVVKKTATKSSQDKIIKSQLISDDRYAMISEAAYHIAEQRNFQGEQSMDDWLQAEAEVDAQFAARH